MTLPIRSERLLLRKFTEKDVQDIIEFVSHSGNPASYRVMERLGMRREGQMREATLRDGQWLDVLVYGILTDES